MLQYFVFDQQFFSPKPYLIIGYNVCSLISISSAPTHTLDWDILFGLWSAIFQPQAIPYSRLHYLAFDQQFFSPKPYLRIGFSILVLIPFPRLQYLLMISNSLSLSLKLLYATVFGLWSVVLQPQSILYSRQVYLVSYEQFFSPKPYLSVAYSIWSSISSFSAPCPTLH